MSEADVRRTLRDLGLPPHSRQTQVDVDELAAMIVLGYSNVAIAAELGCHPGTVAALRRRHGL